MSVREDVTTCRTLILLEYSRERTVESMVFGVVYQGVSLGFRSVLFITMTHVIPFDSSSGNIGLRCLLCATTASKIVRSW